MRWTVGLLILLVAWAISGCDGELEAEQRASAATPLPTQSAPVLKDGSYWHQVVFGDVPVTTTDSVINDPFEPMIVNVKSQPDRASTRPAEESQPTVTLPEHVTVTGIIEGRVPVAILKVDGKEHLVEVGNQIGEGIVQGIEPGHVLIEAQGRVWTLNLQETEW